MKFLVDNAISPQVSAALRDSGHDSVHVRELGIHASPDAVILDRAFAEQRIVVTADTDFGSLLRASGWTRPSVVQFRHGAEHRPRLQVRILLDNLPSLGEALENGAIVTIEPTRVRVRTLPLV